MSELKLEGTIKLIKETEEVTNTFSKREFVIETDDQYPQVVKFETTQDKCSMLDDFKEGELVTVHFNVRGREWVSPKTNETVYFVTLNAWRIEKGVEDNYPSNEPDVTPPVDDELPF